MPDRDVIIAAVDRTERRLKAARFVSDLAVAAPIVLATALLVEVGSVVVPVARGLAGWVVALGLGGVALMRGASLLRERAPDRAAVALDRAAGLADELRTAHWFLGRGVSSPWLDVLVRRASARAATLDVRRLVPVTPPRRPVAGAALLAVALLGVGLLPLGQVGRWLTISRPAPLSPEEQARIDQLEGLVGRMTAATDAARRAQIEALLERLRKGGLSPEETLAIVAELRRLVGETAAPAHWREALDRTAAALESASLTRGVGEALRAAEIEEAASRLDDLASTLTAAAGRAAQGALDQAAREAGRALGGFGENAGQAADALRRGDADTARERLQQAAGDLKEMAERRDREELGRMADRQLEELERAFGERFRSPGQSDRAVQKNERQALPSNDTSPDGAVPRPGAGQGKAVPGQSGQPQPGSVMAQGDRTNAGPGPLGGPAGPSGTIQPLGNAVRLRQQLLAAGQATGEAPGREQVTEDTRASRVTAPYRPVEAPASYAAADPVTSDVVPWSYRALVRTYFQVLGPRGSREK